MGIQGVSEVDISVIIVTYNVMEETRACLQTLIPQLQPYRSEIIVVDNASDDGTVIALQKEFPGLVLVPQRSNLGFAPAINAGIRISSGRYLLLLNPDTLLLSRCIDHLIQCLDRDTHAGAAGPRAYWDTSRQFMISCLKVPSPLILWLTHSICSKWNPLTSVLLPYWRMDWDYWFQGPDPFPVPAIGGAYIMMKREALDAIGGQLDATFFLGYEDVDLAIRLHRNGYQLLTVPQAELVHYYGASKRKSQAAIAHCTDWTRDPLQFITKYYGTSPGRRFSMALNLEATAKGVLSRIFRKSNGDSPGSNSRATDILLEWSNSTHSDPYLVEIATSPTFFDKFGIITSNRKVLLGQNLQQNLLPGLYFYRIFGIPPTMSTHIGSGTFHVPVIT